MKLAAAQLNSTADPAAGMAAAGCPTGAVFDQARLILLPENWTLLGTGAQLGPAAKTLNCSAISRARA